MSEQDFVDHGGERFQPDDGKPFYWSHVEVFGDAGWGAQGYFGSPARLTKLILTNGLLTWDRNNNEKYLTISPSIQYNKPECDVKFEQLAVRLGKTYRRFDARPEQHYDIVQRATLRSAKMTFPDRVLSLEEWAGLGNTNPMCRLRIRFELRTTDGGFQ